MTLQSLKASASRKLCTYPNDRIHCCALKVCIVQNIKIEATFEE